MKLAKIKDQPSTISQCSVRIDKWLWAVRICKTRVIASDLCNRQKVSVDGQNVKPSRKVQSGQLISVRRDGIEWGYKVLNCIEKRVGPSEVVKYRQDVTPQAELDKLTAIKNMWVPRREKGEGRPTKKDRRDMERLFNPDE